MIHNLRSRAIHLQSYVMTPRLKLASGEIKDYKYFLVITPDNSIHKRQVYKDILGLFLADTKTIVTIGQCTCISNCMGHSGGDRYFICYGPQ